MTFKDNLKKFFGVYDDVPQPHDTVALGWSAADVEPHELVDDEWIKNNTKEVK